MEDPSTKMLESGKIGDLRKYLLNLSNVSSDELRKVLHSEDKKTSMLHKAISIRDDATICSVLLSFGSNPNERDGNGNTPLHICAKYGRYRCAALLLLFGAKNDIKNERGLNPASVAKEARQYYVMSILDQSSKPEGVKDGDKDNLPIRCARDLNFMKKKQSFLRSKSTEIALTLVTSTLNALIDRATAVWKEHRERKKDGKLLGNLISTIRASVRATTKSLGPLGTLKYFEDWAFPRHASIRRVSVLPRDVICEETAEDSRAAWGLGCVKSIRRLGGTKDLYFRSKVLNSPDKSKIFWEVNFSHPVKLAAIQISWIRRCIPNEGYVILVGSESVKMRKYEIKNMESKVWYLDDLICSRSDDDDDDSSDDVRLWHKLTFEFINLKNPDNSEDIIAFENVEFFEYAENEHMTDLVVHNSLSDVLKRCSRFGFASSSSSSLLQDGKEERAEEERNMTQEIPPTLEQLRMDSTVPLTQLSISSGSLESMIDVVTTILMNVSRHQGEERRKNHIFPEDLFRSLEHRIDEIVREQQITIRKNLKHQTSDSISDIKAKFDKNTVSATSQSITLEEQGMLIRSTVGVNSSVLLDIGFKAGKAAWEMELVEDTTSQCTCFGAATKPVTDSSYERSSDMWMYRCYNGQLYARSVSSGRKCKRIKKGNIIRMELDMDVGTLRYIVNGEDQGVCFTDMNRYGEVFPAVAFYGQDRAVRLLRVECTARVTPFRLSSFRPCCVLMNCEDETSAQTMIERLHTETVVKSRSLVNSLCLHPVSDGTAVVVYDLKRNAELRKFEELHTHVAISDDPEKNDEDEEEEEENNRPVASGVVNFEIWGDGNKLWSSPEIRVSDRKKTNWKDDKFSCIVPILHVQFLELRTRCKGPNVSARCVWVEPVLIAETMSSRFHREMFSKIPPLITHVGDFKDVMSSLAARLLEQLGRLADARLRLIRNEKLFSSTPLIPETAAFPYVVCISNEALNKTLTLLKILFRGMTSFPKENEGMIRCALQVLKVNLRTYTLSLANGSWSKSTKLERSHLKEMHDFIVEQKKKKYGTFVNTSLSQILEILRSFLETKSIRRCRMIRSAASAGVLEIQVKWPVIRYKTENDARYERLLMLLQLLCQEHNYRYEFLGAYVRLAYVVIEVPENEDIVSVLRHDFSSCFAQAGFDTWTFPDGETSVPIYSEDSGTNWNRDEDLAHSPGNGYVRMYNRNSASYSDVLRSVRGYVNDSRWGS